MSPSGPKAITSSIRHYKWVMLILKRSIANFVSVINCFACVPKQCTYPAAIICCLSAECFWELKQCFWVLNFDLSDALTLRGVKFWLSNAQPGVQFLMNDAYFSTEFERIWNTILTQRCISIGNFRHGTPYTFVSIIAFQLSVMMDVLLSVASIAFSL